MAAEETQKKTAEPAFSEKEKKLYSIISGEPENRFAEITYNEADPDLLYQLSPWRANLTDFLPIRSGDTVLEMQAGYGPLTAGLARKAGSVVCLEQTPQQYRINTRRQQGRANVECGLWEISGGDAEIQKFLEKKNDSHLDTVRKFNWIIIFVPDSVLSLKSELEMAAAFTADHGRVVVAVDNKAGMRSRNGGSVPRGAMTKRELQKLFDTLGWSASFYYPYPSLEFPESIYSDRFLPRAEELSAYSQSFYRPRLCWFDEQTEYASALENHFYPSVANAYLCILTKKSKDAAQEKKQADGAEQTNPEKNNANPLIRFPIYVKYSNQRSSGCNTVTSIYEDSDGKRSVSKRAFDEDSRSFVAGISEKYLKLSGIYAGTKFRMNRCERNADTLGLEYLTGRSLDTVLDRCLAEGRRDLAEGLIDEYWQRLISGHPMETFKPTHEFRDVFGDNMVTGTEASLPATNIDMIFPNILIPDTCRVGSAGTDGDKDITRPDDTWDVIDYEWTFDFPIPVKYVMYRALFYYGYYRPERGRFVSQLYDKYGIDPETRETFRLMEDRYQRWTIGTTKPIRDHFAKYGKPDVVASDLLGEIAGMQMELKKLRKENADLGEDKKSLQDEVGSLQMKSNQDDQTIAGLNQSCMELTDTVNQIHNSASWKITAPFRAVISFFRRLFRKGDRS